MDMTPRQIVAYLDDSIIGQKTAKKTIALALRNRYRRMMVEPKLQEEIMPKNILMIAGELCIYTNQNIKILKIEE